MGQKKSPEIRMMFVIATAVVIVVAASATLMLRSSIAPVSGGAGRLEIDRTEIDLGTLPFDHWVTAIFKIRNVGDGPLMIRNTPRAEAVLGC